jgi:aminopeptidase N
MIVAAAARLFVVLPAFLYLFVMLTPAFGSAAVPLHHELTVTLDPQSRQLRVRDQIRIGAGRELVLRLAGRFQIEQALIDGRALTPGRDDGDGAWRLRVRAPVDRSALVEVRYSGELDALDEALDHRQVLGLSQPLAGAQGAFLAANTLWYPATAHDLVTYRMKVVVPAGFRSVAPGQLIAEGLSADGFEALFEAREPSSGIDLMAGPYVVVERTVHLAPERTVRLRTYFHQGLEQLAQPYLDSAAAYLARYDATIGPYAFPAYSVVSSALPVGFGMPGIAYLGKQVLRLPFIRSTSLGHEVLHDWWGNGVYPDYARGNWSEGLTTFLADYAFKEDEGAAQARAMRIAWLRDYAAVRPEHDRPLSTFVSRRHGADQALGYNKSAFVFFMLRDAIGDEAFRAGLRRFWSEHRFRVASWGDLRLAFEASAGRDLQPFFAQWITRPGGPRLEVISARRTLLDGRYRLTLELRQADEIYVLSVPVRVSLHGAAPFETVVQVAGRRVRVEVDVPGRPLAVAIDPDVRVFRRLDRNETVPILREVMLDRRVALVAAGHNAATRKTAGAVARAVLEHSPRIWAGGSITDAPPLLIIGVHADVADFLATHALPGVPNELKARGTAFAYAQRSAEGEAYAVVSARDVEALAALMRALPHLGAQSFVVFEGARSIERGLWPAESRRYVVTE